MEDWRKSTTWFCGKCCGLLTSPDHPTGISSHSYLHLCTLVSWLLVRRSFYLFIFHHLHISSNTITTYQMASGQWSPGRSPIWIGDSTSTCTTVHALLVRGNWHDSEQERRCSDPRDISNLRVLIESGRTDQAMCTEGPSSKWEIDYREWKAWMRGGVRLGGGITVPILAMAPKWL